MCTRLKKLRPMHMGPVFCVRTLVGSPVAAVSGDSPACDLALFAHPFVEGAASGRLQRSFIDDRQPSFAPEAAVPNRECATSPLFTAHYPSSKVVTPNTRSSRNGGIEPESIRAG